MTCFFGLVMQELSMARVAQVSEFRKREKVANKINLSTGVMNPRKIHK